MRLPPALLAPLLIGSLVALSGGHWDDAWHTERGRDEFLIAPHIAIYGGIALAGAALTLWVLLAARRVGLRAVLAHRPLALALLAVGATLASGPIDNAWHLAFGRDAVIWSPPHTLGIVGTAALGVALLVELARAPAGWSRFVQPVAGAFVLAALTFLVVEYETDVPQFDALWYLPVLAATSALALAIVRRLSERRWAATEAALVHVVFVVAVSLLLLGLEFDTPMLPLLVIPALALDLAWARRAPITVHAAGYVAALLLAYVPTVNWLGEGVELTGTDVVLGLPLALVLASLVFAAVFGGQRPQAPSIATALGAGVTLALVLPASALAHDPGQGDDAGTLAMTVTAADRAIVLDALAPPRLCRALDGSGQLVARRAGMSARAALGRSGCRYRGRLSVPQRGRWFVYAELARGGETVEAWLPVKTGEGPQRTDDPRRYAYIATQSDSSAVKLVAGTTLYVLMLALLGALVVVVRAETRGRPGPRAARSDAMRSVPNRP